jgi:hypothetical protein
MFLEDLGRTYNNTESPVKSIGEARKALIRIFGTGKEENDIQRIYEIMRISVDSYENDTHYERLISNLRITKSEIKINGDYAKI